MPIPHKYIANADEACEAEASYYLHFQLISALVSLDHINNCKYSDDSSFESKAQYYHYYVDHLLYSLGQISERFRMKINPSNKEKNFYARRSANRVNYGFDEVNFPILSNKNFRNTIEHIDEHNLNVINTYNGVGGFNYIDEDTNSELKEALLKKRNIHTYTLDLLSKQIYIGRNDTPLTLKLDDLNHELIELKNRVDDFWGF